MNRISVRSMIAVVALPPAIMLIASLARGQEIRYEIEFLDRDTIESPNVVMPAGGTVDGGWIVISTNGRYVAGFVWDDQAPGGSRLAYRLDRNTGAVDFFEELRFGSQFGIWVNNLGHLLAFSSPGTGTEMVFWSEATGALTFGPSTPSGTRRGFTRILNNQGDVLLRPLPWAGENGSTGGILWNPVLGTQVDVPFSSAEIGDQGVVVGGIGSANDSFGFAWNSAAGAVELANPAGDATVAYSINDAGVIVGERWNSGAPSGAILWPDASAHPLALPCPEPIPGLVIDCAATHVDASGRVYGGGSFDDGEPLVQLVWDGGTAYMIDDLLLNPDAFCGFTQVTDPGELVGWCEILDSALPWPESVVQAGPVILHPVSTGMELDCSSAVASPGTLWPPNHKLEPIEIAVVTTADVSGAAIQVTAVWQDEPVDGDGDGHSAPDAFIDSSGGVSVRRERSGLGDGRIYEIEFEANDGTSSCSGSVIVGVPHDRGLGSQPVDSGARYDSTTLPE